MQRFNLSFSDILHVTHLHFISLPMDILISIKVTKSFLPFENSLLFDVFGNFKDFG